MCDLGRSPFPAELWAETSHSVHCPLVPVGMAACRISPMPLRTSCCKSRGFFCPESELCRCAGQRNGVWAAGGTCWGRWRRWWLLSAPCEEPFASHSNSSPAQPAHFGLRGGCWCHGPLDGGVCTCSQTLSTSVLLSDLPLHSGLLREISFVDVSRVGTPYNPSHSSCTAPRAGVLVRRILFLEALRCSLSSEPTNTSTPFAT